MGEDIEYGGPGPEVTFPDVTPTNGVTLRDWFAGQALCAVALKYATDNKGIGTDHLLRNVPIIAYQIADAMIRTREAK